MSRDVDQQLKDMHTRLDAFSELVSAAKEAAANSATSAARSSESAAASARSAAQLAPIGQRSSDDRDPLLSFGGPAVLIIYVMSAGLLAYGTADAKVWPMWAMLGVFTIWDGLWLKYGPRTRTAQETLNSSTRARTYMSYLLAAYGAGLAFFLFRFTDGQQLAFVSFTERAGIPAWLPVVPLGLFGIALLFIPIRLEKGAGDMDKVSPSDAGRYVLAFTAWTQKIGTYIFLYSVITIVVRIGEVPAVPDTPVDSGNPPLVKQTHGTDPGDVNEGSKDTDPVEVDADFQEEATLVDE